MLFSDGCFCGIMEAVFSVRKAGIVMKTIRVAAAVITDDLGRIYAAERGYGPQKGGWEFPGGKLEPGETAREALVREIREELDITIEAVRLICTIEYDYPDFHLSMDCFRCRIVSGQIRLKEAQADRWLRPEELDSVNWLPADRELLPLLSDDHPLGAEPVQ